MAQIQGSSETGGDNYDNTAIVDDSGRLSVKTDISDSRIKAILNNLRSLNCDTSGRLRVASESTANMTTLTTLTNVTNWGLSTATAKSQWESYMCYQNGFRRNCT